MVGGGEKSAYLALYRRSDREIAHSESPENLRRQIDAAEIERIAHRAGKSDRRNENPAVGTASLRCANASMPPILPLPESGFARCSSLRLQAEDVIAHFLRRSFFFAGHFTKRQRLTEWINHDRRRRAIPCHR